MLCCELARIREQISLDLRTAGLEVQQWTDWKHVVAEHPLVALGLSAFVGYWMVPGRLRGPAAGGMEDGPNGQHLTENTQPAAGRTGPGEAWRQWIVQLALQTAWRVAFQAALRVLRPSTPTASSQVNGVSPMQPRNDR